MRWREVATVVLSGAMLGSIQAQEGVKEPASAESALAVARPAPEMEKRKWVLGTWSVTETHEKSDWSPGGIGKGTSVIASGPGGHSQIISYTSTGPNGKYSGHGIIAWDLEARVYRSAWADSASRGMITMDCREEGKDWVCSGESMLHGKKLAMRSRSIAPNPAGWKEVTEMSTNGGPFTKVRTFEFTRPPR